MSRLTRDEALDALREQRETRAGATSPPKPESRPGRYDHAKRRRSVRRGREKGCSVYIAADELERAGYDPDGPPPYYRVWGSSRGGLFVRLYREP